MARIANIATSRRDRPEPARAMHVSPETRQRMIGEAAYFRYRERGLVPGHELEDWLAAEAEFDRARRAPPPQAAIEEEFGMQHGGPQSPAEDDALKRFVKQHPRRDIPRIESVEPEEAPLKE